MTEKVVKIFNNEITKNVIKLFDVDSTKIFAELLNVDWIKSVVKQITAANEQEPH